MGKEARGGSYLRTACEVKIQRHTLIRGEANPFDLAWETYFEQRLDVKMEGNLTGRRHLLYLWKEQNGELSAVQSEDHQDYGMAQPSLDLAK